MGKITLILVTLLSVNSFAQGNRLAEKAQRLAQELALVESRLSKNDSIDIQLRMSQLEQVLFKYQSASLPAPTAQLSCVSYQAAFDTVYAVTDLNTNTRLGVGTSWENCSTFLAQSQNGLVCIGKGSALTERFGLYDLAKKDELSAGTTYDNCLKIVETSNANFVCRPQGNNGLSEKFKLYNRQTGADLGGSVSLESCLRTMPR